MIEKFFKWMKKHDYFISGIIVVCNIIASIQSFERQDTTWGYINLFVALSFWYVYIINVNKEEPK